MNKKRLFAAAAMLLLTLGAGAQRRNTLFEDAWDALASPETVFSPGGAWLPYPAYADRKACDKFFGDHRQEIIARGETFLHYEWKHLYASTYLEYEKTGNRALMDPEVNNRVALGALMLAELAEGKGRFIPKMADAVWMESQRISWSHAEHTKRQASRRTLPSAGEHFITLHSAANALTLSFVWHYFHTAFDELDPSISEAVAEALRVHIFEPYMDASKESTTHAFFGFSDRTDVVINNWNPYCNLRVALAFLLVEQDPAALLNGLHRTVESVDRYLSYITQDGCCDEGPSYWRMSFGVVYEYAKMLRDASGGKIDVLGSPLLRAMGEYKSKMDLGGGWVVDFADGPGRFAAEPALLWRMGRDTGSKELKNYAVFKQAQISKKQFKPYKPASGDLYDVLETLAADKDFRKAQDTALARAEGKWDVMGRDLRENIASIWYPETQQCVLRNDAGWILAAKAGHNNESHNHNDVGSGILYVDDCPVLVDPGTGDYRKETFSAKRYTIWYIGSSWHNVPLVNGQPQHSGREAAAHSVDCDIRKGVFTADCARAYGPEAACRSWKRTWTLSRSALTLDESYELTERHHPDEIRFITAGQPVLPGTSVQGNRAGDGEVLILTHRYKKDETRVFSLSFPEGLTPEVDVEEIPSSDKKMYNVWGDRLYRIRFVSSADAPLQGNYRFKVVAK